MNHFEQKLTQTVHSERQIKWQEWLLRIPASRGGATLKTFILN